MVDWPTLHQILQAIINPTYVYVYDNNGIEIFSGSRSAAMYKLQNTHWYNKSARFDCVGNSEIAIYL